MDKFGARYFVPFASDLTGDTRKIFVSNSKTVDESHSARVLIIDRFEVVFVNL